MSSSGDRGGDKDKAPERKEEAESKVFEAPVGKKRSERSWDVTAEMKAKNPHLFEALDRHMPPVLTRLVHEYDGRDYFDKDYNEAWDNELLALAKAAVAKKAFDGREKYFVHFAFQAIKLNCVYTLLYLLDQKLIDPNKLYEYDRVGSTNYARGAPIPTGAYRSRHISSQPYNETLIYNAIFFKRLGIARLLMDTCNLSRDTMNQYVSSWADNNTPGNPLIAAIDTWDLDFTRRVLDAGAEPGRIDISRRRTDGLTAFVLTRYWDYTPLSYLLSIVRNPDQKPDFLKLFLAYEPQALLAKTSPGASPLDYGLFEYFCHPSERQHQCLRLALCVLALTEGGDSCVEEARHLKAREQVSHIRELTHDAAGEFDVLAACPLSIAYKKRFEIVPEADAMSRLFDQYAAFAADRPRLLKLWSDLPDGSILEKTIQCLQLADPGQKEQKTFKSSSLQSYIDELRSKPDHFQDPQVLLDFIGKIPRADQQISKIFFLIECKVTENILERTLHLTIAPPGPSGP